VRQAKLKDSDLAFLDDDNDPTDPALFDDVTVRDSKVDALETGVKNATIHPAIYSWLTMAPAAASWGVSTGVPTPAPKPAWPVPPPTHRHHWHHSHVPTITRMPTAAPVAPIVTPKPTAAPTMKTSETVPSTSMTSPPAQESRAPGGGLPSFLAGLTFPSASNWTLDLDGVTGSLGAIQVTVTTLPDRRSCQS
jgi:hypothetical protein